MSLLMMWKDASKMFQKFSIVDSEIISEKIHFIKVVKFNKS